jgi:hypothetical protein
MISDTLFEAVEDINNYLETPMSMKVRCSSASLPSWSG